MATKSNHKTTLNIKFLEKIIGFAAATIDTAYKLLKIITYINK